MTRERPILFSGPMVRAILEGRKTQTRRVVKLPPRYTWDDYMAQDRETGDLQETVTLCPYGKPGDVLYVKEPWCHKCGDDDCPIYNDEGNLDSSCVHYKADGYEVVAVDGDGFRRWTKNGREASPWESSIHMPRWASRITLEVAEVRVERLQDISEEDAIAEGVRAAHRAGGSGQTIGMEPRPYTEAYARLWNELNAKRGYPWESNPFVWVLSFKRYEEEEGV